MKYIEKNGYKISEMTLGTVQLGMSYGINNSHGMPTVSESNEILKTARELGVISFDTSRDYGKSEEILGDFFASQNDAVSLITKIDAHSENPDKLYDELARQIEESAKRLKVEKIPFVKLHRESYVEKYGKALNTAMKKLKTEGLVSNVGISFSDKSKVLELTDPDVYDCIQLPLNLFDTEIIKNGTLKKVSDMGVAVFIRSVYLQGLFFKNPDTLSGNLEAAKTPLIKLRELAEEENVSVSQLALSFIRDTKGVDSVILGCETKEQLIENADLFSEYKISDKVHEKILELSETVPSIVIRPWEWNK